MRRERTVFSLKFDKMLFEGEVYGLSYMGVSSNKGNQTHWCCSAGGYGLLRWKCRYSFSFYFPKETPRVAPRSKCPKKSGDCIIKIWSECTYSMKPANLRFNDAFKCVFGVITLFMQKSMCISRLKINFWRSKKETVVSRTFMDWESKVALSFIVGWCVLSIWTNSMNCLCECDQAPTISSKNL